MVPVMSLWVPILLSAVIVFAASTLIHMVLPIHKNDLKRFPNEEAALDALRRLNVAPGDYGAPMPGSMAAMKEPAFVEKLKKGPLVFATISAGGSASMGKPLTLWFLYTVVVGIFAAYISGRALGPGSHYLEVFRFAGCSAFLCYSMSLPQNSIWWRKNWGTTLKSMTDGLIYGLLTAGTFGWLWPR